MMALVREFLEGIDERVGGRQLILKNGGFGRFGVCRNQVGLKWAQEGEEESGSAGAQMEKLERPDLLAYRPLYELIAERWQAQDHKIKGMPRKL
jgi:hypothetical protein